MSVTSGIVKGLSSSRVFLFLECDLSKMLWDVFSATGAFGDVVSGVGSNADHPCCPSHLNGVGV